MTQPEGLKTSVTKFEVLLSGVEKEKAHKALGSHWRMKVWREGSKWGCHFTCQELPHLNSLELTSEGVEKCIDNPLAGGKAKVRLEQTSLPSSVRVRTERSRLKLDQSIFYLTR